MPDPDKKMLRQLKRIIKKKGNKHRRQQLKKDLIENPEEAHLNEENFGKCESQSMNGIDNVNKIKDQDE